MTKRKENDNKITLDEQEQEIETINDVESEEFPDEPSIDEDSTSSNIEVENDRRERNRKFILIPIIITGLMMIIVGAVGYVQFNSDNDTSSSSSSSIAGIITTDNNQDENTDAAATTTTVEDLSDRTKSLLEQLCTLDNISNKEGRQMCKTACKDAKCCYTKNARCTTKQINQKLCDQYESCMILGITDEIGELKNNKDVSLQGRKKKNKRNNRPDEHNNNNNHNDDDNVKKTIRPDKHNNNNNHNIVDHVMKKFGLKKDVSLQNRKKKNKRKDRDDKDNNNNNHNDDNLNKEIGLNDDDSVKKEIGLNKDVSLQQKMNNACSKNALKTLHQKRLCTKLCEPAECCYENKNCPSNSDRSVYCISYNSCSELYSSKATAQHVIVNNDEVQKANEEDDDFYFDLENYYDVLEDEKTDDPLL